MTEREQLPDTTAAWTIYQSSGGGGDEYYCMNNTVQSGTRPAGLTSTDGITSERYGNTVYCRAPGIAPPTGKVPFEFTVERNGANNDATLVAACEMNPVIDGSRPSDYAHEVWHQADANVIRCFGYGTPPPPPDLYAVGDPGHIQAHADLVASVNDELDRFGLGDPLPIKEEGDEAHLDDHNAIRAKLETLEQLAGQTFTHGLPPVRSLGDPSHTDDHNQLAWAASEVKGWDAWNAATGGTVQTFDNYNGTGETWKVHTFTGSGTLTVTSNAQPFRVLMIGGGGGGGMGGGGGGGAGGLVNYAAANMDTGARALAVGAGGAGSSNGGASSLVYKSDGSAWVAAGGGKGGNYSRGAGGAGGCGGGGGITHADSGCGGGGGAGYQGANGAQGRNSHSPAGCYGPAGGGGGVGGSPGSHTRNGIYTDIRNTSEALGGGGGGGDRGVGGAGPANEWGGGQGKYGGAGSKWGAGGGGNDPDGAAGGRGADGVVIVAYRIG